MLRLFGKLRALVRTQVVGRRRARRFDPSSLPACGVAAKPLRPIQRRRRAIAANDNSHTVSVLFSAGQMPPLAGHYGRVRWLAGEARLRLEIVGAHY